MADNPPSPPLIPEARLSHGEGSMPLMGLGTGAEGPVVAEMVKEAVLEAIKAGYRHFDSASSYQSEQPVGDAVREAIDGGLIASREELFITSKLWLPDAHPDLVLPALRTSLSNLKMEYVDLYLVHWPMCSKPGKYNVPPRPEDLLPMDYEGVWAAMEECQKLGLAKAIGVCNFSCKKLEKLMAFAKIPPAVNQVEVNPIWQQKKLIDFCKEKGIMVTAYSPLGAPEGSYSCNNIMECQILKEIAEARGKTIPQVCLRWAYEQGISLVPKSFNKERMKQNLDIFTWELTAEDHEKIREIPQNRGITGSFFLSSTGPFKTLEEVWDGEL